MIVVAGASAGIGLEIARCLSTNGEMVCGIARRPLSEIPGGAELFTRYIQMDLTSQSVNERLDVELADFSTEISGWVNNIGKSGWRKIEEIDLNFIEDLMKTNLYPYVLMSKSAIKMSAREPLPIFLCESIFLREWTICLQVQTIRMSLAKL